MAALPANLSDRVRGMLTAAAVGDALGWPQELRSSIVGGQKARAVPPQPRFRAWERNSGTQYSRYQETVNAGEYSDDTQLLLAVARSCLVGEGWLPQLARVELPTWLLYHRGAGRAVISAARAWADGHPPWERGSDRGRTGDPVGQYFQAGANGAAMRIAPHAVITVTQDTPTMLSRVVADAITTHGHPRALVGAAVHALALRHALTRTGVLEYGDLVASLLDDSSWQGAEALISVLPPSWLAAFEQRNGQPAAVAWKATVRETRELLDIASRSLSRAALANDEQTLEALGCFDVKRNGAGTITSVAAAYIATRSAARPMTGLLRSAFLPGADTDTLASMTASLLGAIHGTRWLNGLGTGVQDSAYLTTVGFQLVEAMARTVPRQASLFHGETQDQPLPGATGKGVRNTDLTQFRDAAFSASRAPITLPDGRRGDDYEVTEIQASGRSLVRRLRLRIDDGQTVVIDQAMRKKAGTTDDSSGATRGQGFGIRVTLRVTDISRSFVFYHEVLGLVLENRAEDSVSFSNGISLSASSHAGDRSYPVPRNVLITIPVADFPEVTARIRSSDSAYIVNAEIGPTKPQFRIRDPDGYDLRLVQALPEKPLQPGGALAVCHLTRVRNVAKGHHLLVRKLRAYHSSQHYEHTNLAPVIRVRLALPEPAGMDTKPPGKSTGRVVAERAVKAGLNFVPVGAIRFKPNPNPPRPGRFPCTKEQLVRERACPSCARRYAGFADYRFCPTCGPLPASHVATDALAAEAARLDALDMLPGGVRAAQRRAFSPAGTWTRSRTLSRH